MVLTIKLGLKPPNEGAKRRKPGFTRRIASSESDSNESMPDALINQPSTSRTPIDKPKNEKTRIGRTPNGDVKKKSFVRPDVSPESTGFGSQRAIKALTGVNNGFVYQLKTKDDSTADEDLESDSSKEKDCKETNGSLVNSSLNEEIPEGTVIVQPEAAPDGEEDWYKSKEFKKQFTRERREKKDLSSQVAPSKVESVFCTACTSQVNPFDKRTFFCHPVLSVVICKSCKEFYDSGPWKLDEDGIEEECRWCGEGGSLSCCDFCCKTFCKRCIIRNLGRAEFNFITSQKKWKCYVCEPSPLKELVAKCAALVKQPVKTEKKEEKPKVNISKKVVKEPKKEKRSLRMQDAAIAEEFLQYLVGNISNKALFMKSLVRLKKEVPKMQKLQMDLSLKHIGEVKSVLKDLEACVQRKLYGDVHKSDSALDGTDPEDFDSPERKSKTNPDSAGTTPELKNEEEEKVKVNKMESAMDVPMDTAESVEGEETNFLQEGSRLNDVGESRNVADAMDTDDTVVNQTSKAGEEHVENNDKITEKSSVDDVDMEGNDGDDEANSNDEANDIAVKETELNEQVETEAKMDSKSLPVSIKQEAVSDNETNVDTPEDNGEDNEETECPSSQHSARKVKVTPRSTRSRRESQGANPRASQEDTEAKLMSMIDGSDDDSSDESDGSDYTPKKSRVSKKTPGKAKKELSKKFSKSAKKDSVSGDDSDHDGATKKRQGPGLDSSNPEDESGFDGIPGESSTEASQDEDRQSKDKVEKSKGQPTSRPGSESSEEESSDKSISEQSDENDKTWGSKCSKKKSRNSKLSGKKKRVESTERDSASEEEMELKRLEGIEGLKRKRNRNRGSESNDDDDFKSEDDEKDVPEEEQVDAEAKQEVEKSAEEKAEPEEKPTKTKKTRKSPAKIDPKSREILSSDSSSDDECDDESDECSGLKWKSLNSSGKKKKDNPEKVPETLLMEELDGDDDEEDDDDDEDDDEEVDGAGSKRNKRKAQKKAEEEEPEEDDEDWDNGAGESRQNGTGGSGDGEKGGGDKRKKGKGKKETDDEDDEENIEENGEEDEEENGEDDEEKDSDDEVGTKKSHPLLRVNISDSSSEDEEEDTSSKKKGKKGKIAPKKKGKATKKKKRKEIDTDDYFTSSESEDLSDEKPKRKRTTRSQTATSTEDSATEVKKPRKRARRKERNTSSDADSSKETTKKRGRGKGKKRRRIKVASESDSENETQTQEDESQEDKKGSGSDGENESPRKGRKQIRRVLKKSKLQAETLAAEEEEKERRKRIEEKRKEIITEEDEKAEKSAVVKSCILEKEKDSDEVILEVDQRIVENLKPHQAEGIQFMFDSTFESIKKADEKGGGCILAHCMGLGKTLQVISYLHTVMTCDDLNVNTCLVVAPLNTVLNWEAEFEKWTGHMDTGINVYEMSSVKNNASRASYLDHWHKQGGVMILGYAMYRNLSLLTHIRKKKEKAIFLKTLVDPGPDIVVCDEGHMLKNERSSISKAMNSINTRRRICLTGTPLQNNLIEYHCMVHFVKPNLLGTLREFKNRFVNPITNGQHSDSTARDVKIMKRRAHVLHNLLSGCVQRKDYTALTKFLPPKHEFVISVRLSEVQIKLYEHYLNTQSGRKDDGTKTQCTSLFSDYQALMNVWTHPRLLQLATQREDRNAARREMNDFVTSEEDDGDESDDSMKAFVISSDSDLDDPWKTSKKKKTEKAEKPSTSNSSRPTRQTRRGRGNNSDSDEEIDLAGSSSENNDGNNSDSSVEVVKSWNTRSRAKESGLSEGASTSAADFYIPPSPEKVNKWYSDFFSDDDTYKIELSGKLVLLFEILKMAESVGEKVLVFSQSLLSLDMIEDMLAHLDEKAQEERVNGEQDLENQIGGTGSWIKGEDYFRMDGSTAAHLRRRWSEIFNDLDNLRSRLFLISTRAGSLGTNLIAANRVIIFDANWNPSHDIQSIFRVYRFGQERATFIYRFIAQGTMEEKIYDRQVIKQSLSQRVVDEHQIERHFTSADLSELYNFVPDRLDDPNRPERPTPVLPKDFFLAELLKTQMKWIVKYHEHDSLLENQMEEELTEEERKQAWNDYDLEKNQSYVPAMSRQINPQDMENIYREGESILRMGEMMLNYPGQAGQYMMGNNIGHPSLAMGGPSVDMPGAPNNMQRILELQSMYRAQMQQQQQRLQQQQQQQRLQMLRQAQAAGQQSEAGTSASMRQLQQIAMFQQQQQRERLLQQHLMKQRQQQQKASSSQGKAP